MHTKRLMLILALATMLSLSACVMSPPPAEPPTSTQAPAARQTQTAAPTVAASPNQAAWDGVLSQWIAANSQFCDAPGGVLLVDSPKGRYLKAAGAANLDDRRPVKADDRFEIGSNTKAFTVILALQLQEAGVLSMDDPLSKWLPKLAARIPNGDRVTLHQLAGNTSGIWDFADPLMQPVIDANDRAGLLKSYTPQELMEIVIAKGEPDFEPGKGWHYSSTNFILLGMIVEAATGKPLSELYQTRIFDPLDMKNSSYLEKSPEPGAIVAGYYKTPNGKLTDVTEWNPTQGGAAGAIVSTAEDMARFIAGLFGGKLFKNDKTLAEMLAFRELTMKEGSGVFAGYGLGLISYSVPGLSDLHAYGHAGQTPGFQTIWFRLPEADTNVILLTNSGTCTVMALPLTLTADVLK